MMKKRLIALLLCLSMMLSMIACTAEIMISRPLNVIEGEMVVAETPTPTPEATEVPAVTTTSEVAETPAPTPETTEVPAVTTTPEVAETPAPTPETTEVPAVTTTPEVAETPAPTPEATETPAVTTTPEVVETPTPTPEVTKEIDEQLVFSQVTDNVGKLINFSDGAFILYKEPESAEYKTSENFSETYFEIQEAYSNGTDLWYYIDHANWPENYADYHFVKASDGMVSALADVEREKKDLSEYADGHFVTVSGDMPADVYLSVRSVSASTYSLRRSAPIDYSSMGFNVQGDVLAALDITPTRADGTPWQPAAGESVLVELNAASMGLSDGDVVSLHHKHGDTVTEYDAYVVIDGKISFHTDGFSVFLVETTSEKTGVEIDTEVPYEMIVGAGDQIFFSMDSDSYATHVWSVEDHDGAIEYTVYNTGNLRIAPWIKVTPLKAGTVTMTRTAISSWTGAVKSKDVVTLVVKEADGFHIENNVAESGRLVPKGFESAANSDQIVYTWSRNDGLAVQPIALQDDGSINISTDRGGVTNSTAPITYTVTAVGPDGTTLGTDSYEVLYGNEILNPSFETPSVYEYDYAYNGYPGLYWKTTAPGTGSFTTKDIEIAHTYGNPYGIGAAADGNQFAELNAEAFGTLYQDLLTTSGAELRWSFSHTSRNNALNGMYVVLGATEYAQEITNYSTINALLSAAKQDAENKGVSFSNNGYGYEFNYVVNGEDKGTYRIWYNEVENSAQTAAEWEKISGAYIIPSEQYLTRLFFASDPSKGSATLGNVIDGVHVGEYLNYIVEYYETNTLDSTESGMDINAYTTVPLNNLQRYLDTYEYPFKILVNGKPYSGTVNDLKNLYIADYGEKVDGAAGAAYSNYDIVVQVYFQVPNVRVTKNVVIENWNLMSATKKQEILNTGLRANFEMKNKADGSETYSASVLISQQAADGTLSASTSFMIDQSVYGKEYIVTEKFATAIPGFAMTTSVEGGDILLIDSDNPNEAAHVKNVVVTNTYSPVIELAISKTVKKERPGDAWTGDTFVFTLVASELEQTLEDSYDVYANDGSGVPVGTATKQSDGTLVVEMTFGTAAELEAAKTADGCTKVFSIRDLPFGTYTVTETNVNSDYSYTQSSVNNTVVISADNVAGIATFTNTLNSANGTLTLKKTVSAGIEIPEENHIDRFNFHVVLATTDYYGEVVASFSGTDVNRSNETITIVDGEFEVSLADGETVLLENLPAVGVTVTEADYSEQGYEASITYDNAEKRIPVNGVLAVECVNSYKAMQGTITVTKTVSNLGSVPAGDEQSFIFHVNGEGVDMDVIVRMADIRANGGTASVTIHSVPLGTYTITEDTSWSWRYTCSNPTQAVTLNADITAVSASFVNTYNNNNWMNDYHYVDNAFTKSTR